MNTAFEEEIGVAHSGERGNTPPGILVQRQMLNSNAAVVAQEGQNDVGEKRRGIERQQYPRNRPGDPRMQEEQEQQGRKGDEGEADHVDELLRPRDARRPDRRVEFGVSTTLQISSPSRRDAQDHADEEPCVPSSPDRA